jgi:shikimate dehydrogenase
MTRSHDTPLALLGYDPDQARTAAQHLRALGLLALVTPADPAAEMLDACRTLGYLGALVAPGLGAALLGLTQPDAAARRAGAVDALALAGNLYATHSLADALTDALESSRYPVRGARALLIGEGADLHSGLALARLGLRGLDLAAADRPEAERLGREVPAGLLGSVLSRHDSALPGLAERADLIVLTGGSLPTGLLQPFHALLDLTGRAGRSADAVGAATVPLGHLAGLRLARRLLHATGQRFEAAALNEIQLP